MKNISQEIKEQIIHYEVFYDLSLQEAKEEVEKIYIGQFKYIPFSKMAIGRIVNKEYTKIINNREKQILEQKTLR